MSYKAPTPGRFDARQNTTDYQHPQETNLLSVERALQYRWGTGEPELRVNLGANSFVISGNVNIPGYVTVVSSPENPNHVHLTEVGSSGILTTPWLPVAGNVRLDSGTNLIGNVRITDGHVTVDNFPSFPSNISITQMPGVTVTNFPSNVRITDMPGVTGNVGVSGNVSIDKLPAVTGNVHVYGNVSVDNFPTNVSITSMPAITGNVTATLTGTNTVSLGAGSLDAFGRLRVSEPYTVFDSALRYVQRGQFTNAVSTGGTVTYDFNADIRNLNVTSSWGSEVIRESKRVFNYQPGKSLLILCSFVMGPAKTNLRQRVGYFGASNGVYFEQADTTKNMVIRSYSSGSVTEERIAQSSWNTDRLDGTGPSGITLDTTASQIFWCDIEWLGVGTVRTGFVINGSFVVCHKFHHANNNSYTTTYMQTASLPIRYEITNTGATSGASTLKQVCCTVMSEAGYNELGTGTTQSVGTGVTTKRVTSAGTYIPLCSIRLNSNRLDAVVIPSQLDILSPTVNYYRWALVLNATLTGANWSSSDSTGDVDLDTAATAISGGTELVSGFADARNTISLTSQNIFQYQLGRTLAGVSDTLTLAITSTSNNADVLGQIGFQVLT